MGKKQEAVIERLLQEIEAQAVTLGWRDDALAEADAELHEKDSEVGRWQLRVAELQEEVSALKVHLRNAGTVEPVRWAEDFRVTARP